jgi:DNA-binding NtrC family response regulator
MPRVQLAINDPTQRTTLHIMLEAEGHTVSDTEPEVLITADLNEALRRANELPTLLLAMASEIPEAVRAMREGVWGYIYLPYQPGEAGVKVAQAASSRPPVATSIAKLEEVEFDHIRSVLRQCKYNQAKTARVLGVGRNTLWRKLKKMKDTGADVEENAELMAGPQ